MTSPISEASVIRLFNSVVAIEQENGGTPLAPPITPDMVSPNTTSFESVQSANEFGNSCRICRYNHSNMQLRRCPCQCKGSVGYIHLSCLKRWILQRRDNRCEICNTPFDVPEDQFNFRLMLKNFWSLRCCGAIGKHLLFGSSLAPLGYVVLDQVLRCMESINNTENETLTVQELLLASCALLTSSALFFQYFEFVTTRFLIIRNILRQWWLFGSSPDFHLVDLENDGTDLF